MPTCFRLLMHWARRAASRAAWTAGRSRAIRTAMMAMTTSSSISVNPLRGRVMAKLPPSKMDKKTREESGRNCGRSRVDGTGGARGGGPVGCGEETRGAGDGRHGAAPRTAIALLGLQLEVERVGSSLGDLRRECGLGVISTGDRFLDRRERV